MVMGNRKMDRMKERKVSNDRNFMTLHFPQTQYVSFPYETLYLYFNQAMMIATQWSFILNTYFLIWWLHLLALFKSRSIIQIYISLECCPLLSIRFLYCLQTLHDLCYLSRLNEIFMMIQASMGHPTRGDM